MKRIGIPLILVMVASIVVGCSRQPAPTQPAANGGGLAPPALASSVPTMPGVDHFVSHIDNPYLPLTPGTFFVYVGEKDGRPEINRVHVTHTVQQILGVACTTVLDTVLVDGEVEEATIDWYAQDDQGNVWYFGEDSKELANGQVISTEGSWQAGVDGALPGIVMQGDPEVGDTYFQEFQKRVAEDLARVLALDGSTTVPYGRFTSCLVTREWTRLDPGIVENKLYARTIGMVQAVTVKGGADHSELVSIGSE